MIVIRGNGTPVTPPMREFVMKQFERVSGRVEKATRRTVDFSGTGWNRTIRIEVKFPKNKVVMIERSLSREFTDFYGTIGAAFDVLGDELTQVTTYKHRVNRDSRRAGRNQKRLSHA